MSKKSELYEQSLSDCRALAQKYVADWQPVDPSWPVMDGATYVRLSTNEQASVAKGSLEQQVNIAYEHMRFKSQQDKINYRIREFFIERPLSGKLANRAELQRMRREIRRKKHGFIISKEISRIARNAKLFIEFLDELKASNVLLIIPGFPIDLNDPAQRLIVQFFAAVAEWEAENSGKRIAMNNRAALKSCGKFNSTHKILGLDAKPNQVGLYSINVKEQATVHLIFQSFLTLRSEEKVLEVMRDKQIVTKNGTPFSRTMLHRMLTNRKLIGEWTVEERDGPRTIKLPHGPVVPRELWDQVQGVIRSRKSRNRINRSQRIYPLSGLLVSNDGKPFRGFSGTGRSQKYFYYRNDANKIQLPVDDIELMVTETMKEIVAGSSAIQAAIMQHRDQATGRLTAVQQIRKRLEKEFIELKNERNIHARHISKLMASDDETDRIIINELKHALVSLQHKQQTYETTLSSLADEERALEAKGAFTWQQLVQRMPEITDYMRERDPKLLKGLLNTFFSKIEVGPQEGGYFPIKFYVADSEDESPQTQTVCGNSELVEAEGIEPSSVRDPHSGGLHA